MDSGEDDITLHVPENPSSPLSRPKLKRLKKAAAALSSSPTIHASFSALPNVTPSIVTLRDAQDANVTGTNSSDATRGETFGQKNLPEPDLDPLFSYPPDNERNEVPDVLERETKIGGGEDEATLVDTWREKSVKRKLSLDVEEEDAYKRKKKKDRSRKNVGHSGKPAVSIRRKGLLEKERKAQLDNFHAESQRLLRETRDASFNPVNLVQKSISSVLEKIQQRKLEILKRNSIQHSEPSDSQINVNQNYENAQFEDERDSQLKSEMANIANARKTSSCPQIPDSTFKFHAGGKEDVASLDNDNTLSTEEDSDKENTGPSPFNAVKVGLSPKKRPGNAFVDDEAEESTDSDCDLLKSQDDDESDADEPEELDDLIDTGYLEAPIDDTKRNELHQKWLEQQDVAETDNVLQRLKYGHGQRHLAFLHDYYGDGDDEEEDDADENDSRDYVGDDKYASDLDDKAAYKHHPIDTTRQSFKKAKQMIAQMFNDVNDVHVPSDDEETEKNLMRLHILKQNNDHVEPPFTSQVEDENSREVFGLIKKLNIAPGNKKRGKASTSVFDSLVFGSSNSSSKSSFLNRSSNSLPVYHKQVSISTKAFIFSRDDSNSRNSFSTSENITDVAQKGSSSAKNDAANKFSNSQMKSSVSKTKVKQDSQSISLFDVLRQTSKQFDQKLESKNNDCSRVITETQATHQFSAFKIKRSAKLNSRV